MTFILALNAFFMRIGEKPTLVAITTFFNLFFLAVCFVAWPFGLLLGVIAPIFVVQRLSINWDGGLIDGLGLAAMFLTMFGLPGVWTGSILAYI